MDIIVQGNSKISVKPDLITLYFDFHTKTVKYDVALEEGVKNVEAYLNALIELGFEKESFKTNSFRVTEKTVYNETKRKYEFDGYLFNQNSTLCFDYDMNKLSAIMEMTSKLENAPTYRIVFGLKDNKAFEEELIEKALEDAQFQAKAIAKGCNKKLALTFKKVSFEPFDTEYCSETKYDTAMYERGEMCCKASVSETISRTFVPEDVVATKTIYCLFEAI